jgi:hypothetical protein
MTQIIIAVIGLIGTLLLQFCQKYLNIILPRPIDLVRLDRFPLPFMESL